MPDQENRSTITVQKQSASGTGIVFGISGIYIRALDPCLVQVKEGSLAPGWFISFFNMLVNSFINLLNYLTKVKVEDLVATC